MKRYLSLDVLRGMTVAFMCIVNNPGSWAKIYPPLDHAGWEGCTPTDLVYPFFLFCAGCAMAFSFSKFNGLDASAVKKIVRRGLLIFLVGFLCNLFPFVPTSPSPELSFWDNWVDWIQHKRIFGVLQRIGLSYMIAGVVAMWLRKSGKILSAIAILSIVYTGILVIFGNEPGPFTLEGNVSGKIDIALVGDAHVYHGFRDASGALVAFDPEGLLGSLMGACTALLGFLAGSMILNSSRKFQSDATDTHNSPLGVTSRTFVYGMLCLALGEILSIWIPISKPLWSVSYVFLTAGWAMVVLGVLMYFIDYRGVTKPFSMFKVMGTNALTAFVMSAVIAKTITMILHTAPKLFFGGFFARTEFTSLLWALIFMFGIFCIQYILYRKKIIIKL
ncbi:MAG: DUF1624 domain-containing protein [Bacteroidales bacterium]|nr:DUF1624 domain-containing protein [Bacteroidales bacterium]